VFDKEQHLFKRTRREKRDNCTSWNMSDQER